jgi:PAS domain S-box-containing protein
MNGARHRSGHVSPSNSSERVLFAALRDDLGRTRAAAVDMRNALHDAEERLRAQARALDRAREKEAASEARTVQLLEALPVAVYTTDARGILTYFNRAAAELSGREPKIGTDRWCVTWRLYTADGTPLPADECPMAVAVHENRRVRNVEILVERPDGTLVPVLPFPTPLTDRNGNVVGGVNVLIDLSERRHAEADQASLLKELNHRVKNNMQMLLSLLSSAARESKTAESEAVLNEAGRRVAVMGAVQQVLYGGDSTGTSYGAKALLQAVARIARHNSACPVSIKVEASETELSNDTAVPIALMLNELLANAVRFGVGPSREIRISLERRPECFSLTVADDGPGFVMDETSSKRASGLGLVRGLARQLGGRLVVAPDDGARVTVTFRDRSMAAAAPPAAVSAA